MRPPAGRGRWALIAGVLLASGCAYEGAVYSSYQEGGLGVRTTADSSAPVKLHFGYDHSVAALVPRRGGDAANEEATSIIAKDEVAATVALPVKIDPKAESTEKAKSEAKKGATMVAVDSAFITGTAAIVASAPSGATVTVQPPGTSWRDATRKDLPGARSFAVEGSAGERIAMALTQRPGELSSSQVEISNVVRAIRAIEPASARDAIWDRAAANLSPDFQRLYRSAVEKEKPRQLAFTNARSQSKSDTDEQVLQALSRALKES